VKTKHRESAGTPEWMFTPECLHTEVSACHVLNREGELDRPLSKLTATVFLLCLAAAIPLAIAEYCSGGDDPNAPMELYDKLDHVLAWTMLACIVVALAGAIYRRMTARQNKRDRILERRNLPKRARLQ
jgi:hypothetical protein